MVGPAYIRAIIRFARVDTWDAALEFRSWRLHPLRQGRRGQWAATLHGRWRIIVTRDHDQVFIEEVSNHYGD
ncbi:MAG TPA: hypothetical protein QGF05_05665 [Dehalococcoidia bacterium]|nr:hypothetical protein [Dehalococcoidia bacterium]